MKKIKISLTAMAFVLGIGAAFAFKAQPLSAKSNNLFGPTPEDCNLVDCTQTSGTACTDRYIDEDCSVLNTNTSLKRNP